MVVLNTNGNYKLGKLEEKLAPSLAAGLRQQVLKSQTLIDMFNKLQGLEFGSIGTFTETNVNGIKTVHLDLDDIEDLTNSDKVTGFLINTVAHELGHATQLGGIVNGSVFTAVDLDGYVQAKLNAEGVAGLQAYKVREELGVSVPLAEDGYASSIAGNLSNKLLALSIMYTGAEFSSAAVQTIANFYGQNVKPNYTNLTYADDAKLQRMVAQAGLNIGAFNLENISSTDISYTKKSDGSFSYSISNLKVTSQVHYAVDHVTITFNGHPKTDTKSVADYVIKDYDINGYLVLTEKATMNPSGSVNLSISGKAGNTELSNSIVVLENQAGIDLLGGDDTISGSGSGNIVSVAGQNYVVNLSNATSITLKDNSSASVNGSSNNVFVQQNDKLIVNGNNDSVTMIENSNSSVVISGVGNTIKTIGNAVNIQANSTDVISGTNNSIAMINGSNVTVNGGNNTISVTAGGRLTVNNTNGSFNIINAIGVTSGAKTVDGLDTGIWMGLNTQANVYGSGNTITENAGDSLGVYGGGKYHQCRGWTASCCRQHQWQF